MLHMRVSEFQKESGDRFQKTNIFCSDEEHAAKMRQALMNDNKVLRKEKPPLRDVLPAATPKGRRSSGNFIEPEAKYPVTVTTSRLLSTGIDAQTCRLTEVP